MTAISREIRLASRPKGTPQASDFELAETELPAPGPGQVLVRNTWMSVDPYMRGRMVDQKSYIPPFQIGAPLEGGAMGVVEHSNHPDFEAGDLVSSMLGWREYFLSDGSDITKQQPSNMPPQAFLGVLGMPGMTAYAGLLRVGECKDGDTVFVSAASGAVGSIVCQIAKAKGCTVIGSAGSQDKIDWLKNEIGIDHAFNYKDTPTTQDVVAELTKAAPGGIDVYFENVGGVQLEAALIAMKPFGRVALCGMIAQYNATEMPAGPSSIIMAVGKSLKLQGFVVSNYFDMMGDFIRDMSGWIAEGKIKWEETVFDGIENAPNAFLALFSGDNFGKCLVKLEK